MLQSLSAFNYMHIHKLIQKLPNLSCHTGFTLSSTNKSINLQQWDPGMLRLICDVEDDTAIAVQRDLHNLECHISVLQLRKSHYLTSITSFFQPLANLDSDIKLGGSIRGLREQFRVTYDLISEFIWSLYIKPL